MSEFGNDINVASRKGVFIPDITVEMFRNASLESVEDLMASGEMEDISLPSAQPEQRWIPCSERLPEKDTHYYLTTIANHGLNFTTTLPDDVDVVRWDYDRRKGHNSWHWCTERTVIAWMPLPEPYEERREEYED